MNGDLFNHLELDQPYLGDLQIRVVDPTLGGSYHDVKEVVNNHQFVSAFVVLVPSL